MKTRLTSLGVAAAALCAAAAPASATITPRASTIIDANAIAQAIAQNPAQVVGASFTAAPGVAGQPATLPGNEANAIGNNAPVLASFPFDGPTYGILTSGRASLVDDPNADGSNGANNNGASPPGRGTNAFDVSTLKVDVNVPAGKNCVAMGYRFLSEEFPEFVGSSFNDAFVAEVDSTSWTTSAAGSESSITAPNDFATASGRVSVNGVGPTAVSPAESVGTTFDAATGLVDTKTVITPGPHSIYLSIFDQSDHIYDSAVFMDRLAFITEDPSTCKPPKVADTPAPPPASGPVPTPAPPSNAFGIGSSITFSKSGTAVVITLNAPGPGTFTGTDAAAAGSARASAVASATKKKALIKPARAVAQKAGPVKMTVKLSSAGKKVLKKKGKVKVKVAITFTPNGGKPATQIKALTFKKKKAVRHRR